jgi:ammonia channel protein AmtB
MSNATLPCQVQEGEIAWTLLATILVLGMVPALGMFEAGLLR